MRNVLLVYFTLVQWAPMTMVALTLGCLMNIVLLVIMWLR